MMINSLKQFAAPLILLAVLAAPAKKIQAAEQGTNKKEFNEMSIEELLNVKVEVASHLKSNSTLRSTPAIVSIITDEEIRKMGYPDLISILRSVPGLDFGSDTQGIVGLAVRGNWAFEGKYLFLLDGEAVNESMFGTVPLGNHFPVALIKRIEIIRGPGSVIYGGTAELAVINVITLDGEDLKGLKVDGTYSEMNKSYGYRNGSLGIGGKTGDWIYTGQFAMGQGERSNGTYTDSQGSSYNLRDNSPLNPTFASMNVKNKEWDFRVILDNYHTAGRDAYGVMPASLVRNDFKSIYLSTKYHLKLNDNFSLSPELHYRRQQPWQCLDDAAKSIPGLYYDKTAERYTANLNAKWNINSWLSSSSGMEWYRDRAKDNFGTFNNGQKELQYDNASLYSEFEGKSDIINFVVGARYEYHNQFFSSFVPRVGLVKEFEPWYFKALYSRSFHSPVIENINGNAGIRPEKTGVAELEWGWHPDKTILLSTNLYDIHIQDPIVYNYSNADAYYNFSNTGTRGIEFQFLWKDSFGQVKLGYSYYKVNFNGVSFYEVPGNDGEHLAFPSHTLNLSSSIKLAEGLSLSPEVLLQSDRTGYVYDAAQPNLVPHRFGGDLLANIYLNKDDFLIPRLTLGLGVTNITNINKPYIQPYTGGKTPLPGRGRELLVQGSYQVEF